MKRLMFGNEAIALAALHNGITLGTGYPGTPSTEILEYFSEYGGKAQWCPNEKVALEVGIGVAFAGGNALVTMKHVGLNVASDPLFTVAYTGVEGALVIISADDPDMHSSQNEQDNRNYARSAGVMMLEPCDSQECYDFFFEAVRLSKEWELPVILRPTTRVCHSMSIVEYKEREYSPVLPIKYNPDKPGRVMIPGYARPAHRRLREKLSKIKKWNETCELNREEIKSEELGIITSGVSYLHVLEAEPNASVLKIGMCYPFPENKVRSFVQRHKRCIVIEEGDPFLVENCRYYGISVEEKPEMYRFGELNVNRVRRILKEDTSPEPLIKRGRPPRLCDGCPHRATFTLLSKMNCIVTGDIGCYTLSVLPPFQAMDSCVCMGASITVGLGLRHSLPTEEAKKVVSVIGDSTFIHSGLPGIVEMVYNPPPTGHVVIVLDNSTTAMTGMQEHPGTGKKLNHEPTNQVKIEEVAKAIGVENVVVTDRVSILEKALEEALNNNRTNLIVVRKTCALLRKKQQKNETQQIAGEKTNVATGSN
ncbi:MAG TPA: thiamine pyrophosphate-dependent enzyme [Candidatus Hydrogenedens sp.]|nr:thiamine pyrophosphate-dependent enzyme [Candidatus Hydrogenedens sp.]